MAYVQPHNNLLEIEELTMFVKLHSDPSWISAHKSKHHKTTHSIFLAIPWVHQDGTICLTNSHETAKVISLDINYHSYLTCVQQLLLLKWLLLHVEIFDSGAWMNATKFIEYSYKLLIWWKMHMIRWWIKLELTKILAKGNLGQEDLSFNGIIMQIFDKREREIYMT